MEYTSQKSVNDKTFIMFETLTFRKCLVVLIDSFDSHPFVIQHICIIIFQDHTNVYWSSEHFSTYISNCIWIWIGGLNLVENKIKVKL